MTLSQGDQQTLDFLRGYIAEHGFAPSYDEIRVGLGMASTSGVAYRLQVLEARGLIRHKPRTPRTIQLVES